MSATKLFTQDSVLLEEELDDLLLAAIDPPNQGENAELEDEITHGRQSSAVANAVGRPGTSSRNLASLWNQKSCTILRRTRLLASTPQWIRWPLVEAPVLYNGRLDGQLSSDKRCHVNLALSLVPSDAQTALADLVVLAVAKMAGRLCAQWDRTSDDT